MSISRYEFVQVAELLGGKVVENYSTKATKLDFAEYISKIAEQNTLYTGIYEFNNGIRFIHNQDEARVQIVRDQIWELKSKERPSKTLYEIVSETEELFKGQDKVIENEEGYILTTIAYISAILISKEEYSKQKVQEIMNNVYNNLFIQMEETFLVDISELINVMKKYKHIFKKEHFINSLTEESESKVDIKIYLEENSMEIDIISKDKLCSLRMYHGSTEIMLEIISDKYKPYEYYYNLKTKTETLEFSPRDTGYRSGYFKLNLQTGSIGDKFITQEQLDDLITDLEEVIKIVEDKILMYLPNYKKLVTEK